MNPSETQGARKIIREGLIADGAGCQPFRGDVIINGDRIEAVVRGGLDCETDAEVIDVRDRVVCPGFIDTHAHDDLYLLHRPDNDLKTRQGITTVICGNCGISPAPVPQDRRHEAEEHLKLLGSELLPETGRSFTDYDAYLSRLDRVDPGINQAGLIGHGMLRLAVMGSADRPPTAREKAEMAALLEACLDQGAFGLSLGLIYAPGTYANLDELADLARLVKQRHGIVAAHIRNEGGAVVEAVDEMIELARRSGAAVHISHHKTADPANRGRSRQTLDLMDRARAEGLEVTADVYPYRAGSTYLAAVLPSGALAHGMDRLRHLLGERDFRAGLRREIETDPLDRWQSLLTGREEYRIAIAHSRARPGYAGRVIAEIAETEGRSPYDVAFDLVLEEGLGASMIIHSMAEEDVQRILAHPMVMIGTDGVPPSGQGKPHPRLTGTFPRVLGRYVRERGLISLAEAIRRMTSLAADTFGLKGKGRLASGMDADLVVFDPRTIVDRSTYDRPELPPEGVDLVMVNGRPAFAAGRVTGCRNGRAMRRGG